MPVQLSVFTAQSQINRDANCQPGPALAFFHRLHLLLNRLPPILSHDSVISIYIYTFHHFISSYIYFTLSVTISSLSSSTTAAEWFCSVFTLLLLHEFGRLLYNISPIVPVCIREELTRVVILNVKRHKSISVKDTTENKKRKLLMVLMAKS